MDLPFIHQGKKVKVRTFQLAIDYSKVEISTVGYIPQAMYEDTGQKVVHVNGTYFSFLLGKSWAQPPKQVFEIDVFGGFSQSVRATSRIVLSNSSFNNQPTIRHYRV
jgi:hypothetical protein